MDYKASGVDIDAGNEAVRRIRGLARSTFTPNVLSDIGSFGGLFRFTTGSFQDPVLVSSADGVGTKLRVAFLAGKHDTVGEDLVNHCVNDILVQGAEPLFFLDYFGTGRLSPAVAESVVTLTLGTFSVSVTVPTTGFSTSRSPLSVFLQAVIDTAKMATANSLRTSASQDDKKCTALYGAR